MAKEKKFRNGPRTSDSGTTHASVSESTIDENDDIDDDDDDEYGGSTDHNDGRQEDRARGADEEADEDDPFLLATGGKALVGEDYQRMLLAREERTATTRR